MICIKYLKLRNTFRACLYILKFYTYRMFIYQVLFVVVICIGILRLLFNLLRHFERKDLVVYTSIPVALFSLGFIMRLSNEKLIIDCGFFLTEISFLLIYSIFAITFVLGQIKYWEK